MDVSKVNPENVGISKRYRLNEEGQASKTSVNNQENQSRFIRSQQSITMDGYNHKGEAISEVQSSTKNLSLAELRESIKQEVWDQTFQLLKDFISKTVDTSLFKQGIQEMVEFSGDENDPLGLTEYFAANPADWEQVMQGEVPDYFNVENTGQRILDLWLPSYDESVDVETWVVETKDQLNAIYDEVAGMVGGLPQLVQDTRDYVMEALDSFANDLLNNAAA